MSLGAVKAVARVTLVTPEAVTGFFLKVVTVWPPPAEIIIIINNKEEVRFFLFSILIPSTVGTVPWYQQVPASTYGTVGTVVPQYRGTCWYLRCMLLLHAILLTTYMANKAR